MTINVLLVDDSAVIRGLMAKALTADPEVAIAGTAANGVMAITMAKELKPNIIILDIEMPVMDGITALPELIKNSPSSKVIMASTLTLRNAAISMQALALGATDYLSKPSAKSGNEVDIFYRDLLSKVKALGGSQSAPASAAAPAVSHAPATADKMAINVTPGGALVPSGARALAIASSTGGPQALTNLFAQLKGKLQNIPIFITQHMPPTFTTILAEHIAKAGDRICVEAQDRMPVVAGQAYLAPGDYHMVAEKDAAGNVFLRINQDAPENFCRPAADPMLRSLSRVYGTHLAVAVLTGMGQDGMEGAKVVVQNGGGVVAQDEKSCVVYGMPKAVVENRLCKAVLPLSELGGYLIQQIDGSSK